MIPGFLGFLVGAALFGLTYQQIFPPIERLEKVGNVIIPDLWNLSPFLAVLLFASMSLLLFYLIDRAGLQRKNKTSE